MNCEIGSVHLTLAFIPLLCLDVIYPPCVVVWPCAGVGRAVWTHNRGNKRAPGPLEGTGPAHQERKQTQGAEKEKEGPPGTPFGMVGPFGVSVTVLLPLHAPVEGCNNKNTG